MDVSCELETSWKSEAGFGLLPGGTSERQGQTMTPPLKQKRLGLEVHCCLPWVFQQVQLVQALEDWGMQEAEERGLGYQGGEIIQRASLPESPLPISSIYYPVLLGLPISGSYLFLSASPLNPSGVYQEISG